MLQIRNAANFVSTTYFLGSEWEAVANPNASADLISSVYEALRRAQSHYQAQRYTSAITEYKRAQSLAYQLLNPRHIPDIHIADDRLMLPVGPLAEAKIAEASIRIAENVRDAIGEPPAAPSVSGFKSPDNLAAYDRIGFFTETAPRAEDKISMAAALLTESKGSQAVEILQSVVDELNQPGNSRPVADTATATLNLSSAYLMAGDAKAAITQAQTAQKLFAGVKDDIGSAQALHNQGAAYRQSGQSDLAKRAFEQASALLKAVSDRWGSTRTPGIPVERRGVVKTALAPVPVVTARPTIPTPGLDLENLKFIETQSAHTVAVRWPGAGGGWGSAVLPNPAESAAVQSNWSLGVESGQKVVSVAWESGKSPQASTLLASVYQPRIQATTIQDLVWRPKGLGEASAYLTHIYAFVIPQSLGDCYHALGNYARAESYYLQAAQYSYLNAALEAPALWIRLANNVADWGDQLYREEQVEEAKKVYSKLVNSDNTPALTSPLYTTTTLAGPAQDAQTLLQNLANPRAANVNPGIAKPLIIVVARWAYLNAGLDFFGTTFTPIFTFEYLQQVARGFAQQSIQAERDYVNFQVHSEAEAATRRELEGTLALANAEVAIRNEQYLSSQEETSAMQGSVDLANLRAQQAQEERDTYADAGYWQYITQSMAAATGAGEDWHEDEIRRLANDIENGYAESEGAKLAAAATLIGGQKSYEYQLQRLDNDVAEMQATIPIAEAQLAAAQHRQEAARLSYEAAQMRADLASDALAAFENEVFTPELWARMAEAMRDLSRSYQEWAIRSAKLMERAYRFETDHDLNVIKNSYPAGSTNGLLGSDYLLRDIDSFTYHYVANTRSKSTSLKDVISLANDYPFHFYQFQQTGRITFETALRDFDNRHPGFFAQRVASVEVEMVGLVPPGGIQGRLSSGSVSRYRTENANDKIRFHVADTMALSEYTARGDSFLFRGDPRMHGLFEGHGLACTWELDVPRRSNNLDYRTLSDVRLILYYTARYSGVLRNAVLTAPALPGELIHVRNFALRYDFPEAWYSFIDSGQMTVQITENYLPRNETNFRTDKIAVRLITRNGVSPANVDITLALPDRAPVTLTTNAEGVVSAEGGNALELAMGGPMFGSWALQLAPQPGADLRSESGGLRGDLLDQVAIVAQYAFDWQS